MPGLVLVIAGALLAMAFAITIGVRRQSRDSRHRGELRPVRELVRGSRGTRKAVVSER